MTSSIWTRWNLEPAVLLGLVATGWLYLRGVRSLWRHGGRGRAVSAARAWAFAGGLAALAVALVSPIDALSTELLWIHMLQHLILILVAAPLLVMGAPALPLMVALPVGWRRTVRRWGRRGSARAVERAFSHPVVIWFLHVAVLWAWHAPALYQAAVRSQPVHAIEHVSFLAAAALFWRVVLQPERRRRLPRGPDIVYVFAAGLQGGALGALFTFASSPLYPIYVNRAAAFGLTALQDQQVAGLIMWVPAGVLYLVAAGWLFVRWIQRVEEDMLQVEGRPAAGEGVW